MDNLKNKFAVLVRKNPHLLAYLREYYARRRRMPKFYERLERELRDIPDIDIIYQVAPEIFIHIYVGEDSKKYSVVEPLLTQEEQRKKDELLARIFERTRYERAPANREEFSRLIEKTFNDFVRLAGQKAKSNFFENRTKMVLTPREYHNILYHIKKDVVGVGILEPILKDPYLEDVTCVGTDKFNVYHKIFGMLETNRGFKDIGEVDEYIRHISERIGKPATVGTPIIDGTLPDGSRINIVYSEEISLRGPSFTVRRFTDEPISVTQLVHWNTLSADLAAYLWLCLENKMSVIACGPTACGKTSTVNAMVSFIPYNAKIYTVEDTAEMRPPHDVWQQLITRDSGPQETRVESYDLLRAAFRSRPDYIVIGEIRGREGAVAFQAMQSGHPVITTFHAESVTQMIQRLTSHPIDVPIRFIDNLNLVLTQLIVSIGDKLERRVTSVCEIVGYVRELNNVLVREAFKWSPYTDQHLFRGFHNSYILEEKISPALGYRNKLRIYEDLEIRKKIINSMIREKIFRYSEVLEVIRAFQWHGIDGLWFPLT
jgi:flagellar protein FlaI